MKVKITASCEVEVPEDTDVCTFIESLKDDNGYEAREHLDVASEVDNFTLTVEPVS